MTGDQGDYALLLDPAVTPDGAPRLELPADIPVISAAEALEALFGTDAGIDRVTVVIGEAPVGATSRRHLMPPRGVRGVGAGDGASLPGYSSAYELLRFACRVCAAVTYRLQIDPRDPPVCERGHGSLGLVE